ncbi:MAG: YqiA/YcfP family alpha/beta fold hydrolase [Aureispira sp.]
MPTILFSHGKHSHPQSTKINYLAAIAQELGYTTHSIDYTNTLDPEKRVEILRAQIALQEKAPSILVGSSMGAYVAAVMASEIPVQGLFLMAPAFYLNGYTQQCFQPQCTNIEIVHGWQDEVVPYQGSIEFGQKHGARLHLLQGNHRLSENQAFLQETFCSFLKRILI